MIKKALTRRGILRAAPAAVVAAPSLAADVKASSGSVGLGHMRWHRPPISGGNPFNAPDDSWVQQRKKDFENIIAGKRDELEDVHDHYNDNMTPALHYDGLRSVSPVRRAGMFADHMRKRNDERRRGSAVISLKRLLAGDHNW